MPQAARKRSGPISPCSKGARCTPPIRRASRRESCPCAGAAVVATDRRRRSRQLEGIKLDQGIVLAGVQIVEVGDAVDIQDTGLAIQHKMLRPDPTRGFHDPGGAIGPMHEAVGDRLGKATPK